MSNINPTLLVDLALALFVLPHLGLAWPGVRSSLIDRWGSERFAVFYSLIATVGLVTLAVILYRVGGQGGPGFQFADATFVRFLLYVVMLVGAFLICAGLVHYPQSAIARLARRNRDAASDAKPLPRPLPSRPVLVRYVRHPFFFGLLLLALAHAVMVATAPMAAFFLGLALLVSLGMPLQDAKLAKLHGETYTDYLASSVDDTAEPNANGDFPWILSFILTVALVLAHPFLQWGNGAGFVILINLFGLGALVMQILDSKKTKAA